MKKKQQDTELKFNVSLERKGEVCGGGGKGGKGGKGGGSALEGGSNGGNHLDNMRKVAKSKKECLNKAIKFLPGPRK